MTRRLVATSDWPRLDLVPYGAALRLPPGWETLPPVPSNGQEIIRATSGSRVQVIVFKLRSHGMPAGEIASRAAAKLDAMGYTDSTTTEVRFAGTTGARLRFRSSGATGPDRTSWEFFAVRGPAVFVLGMSTSEPDDDLPVVEAVAGTFELVPAG